MTAAGSPAPATDRCPRCGAAFRCGMPDAAPCACTRVSLDARQRDEIAQHYRGCLCVRCLGEIAAGVPAGRSP